MLNASQGREVAVNRVHNVGVDNLFNGFNKQVFVIKVNDVPSSIAENDEVSPKRFACFFQNDLVSKAAWGFVSGFYGVRERKITMHRGCIRLGFSL